jgi:uncharacterized protein (DUF697 family)
MARGFGGFGMLGTVRSMVSVLREMSFDDVRDDAERAPKVLVLAANGEDARSFGDLLTGERTAGTVDATSENPSAHELRSYEAVVIQGEDANSRADRIRADLDTKDGGGAAFVYEGAVPSDKKQLNELRQRMMNRLPDRAPAFGRAFPGFRSAAAKSVIDETAKANAQFALVSNIPAVVPLVGGLMAASADFLVLTKNQLMLLYKVAAIHGRDLSDQFAIFREMVPVVGAGLAWRTVAREIASFVPFAAGTIPKVAVAYAGTLSVGRAADYYYRFGHKPDRDQMKDFYKQATDRVKSLPFGKSSANGSSADTEGSADPHLSEKSTDPASTG